MPKTLIVTPTYNERENIEELVKKISECDISDLKIVVVDDNSPDGTAELAEKLASKFPLLVLKRERKSGLGTAYVHAFKKILAGEFGENPDFIIQMDADLSHEPKAILNMLTAAQNHDLVLGSRYIPGGAIKNWNVSRRLLSRFGNIYARAILGLPYRDLTGGFKCFKRHVLENIDLDSLSSVGYNFQIETTHKAHQKGYKIKEIPITFAERKTGQSKINIPIILESFWKVLALRFKK